MIHPYTELKFISPEKGFGVVATQFIPKGTITWAADMLDQVFTPEDIKAMPSMFRAVVDKYSYRDHEGHFILCWDHSRYINHSFNSNCISTAYNFELAIRDIQEGEELTDDYGYLNVTHPLHFLPEPDSKRTIVMPDDLLHFHEEWDAKLISAFAHFNSVEQPLAQVIMREYAQKVRMVAAGKEKMHSILNCYYNKGGKKIAA